MRFLADESCDFSIVRALRSADHDVLAIAEVSPREEDNVSEACPESIEGFNRYPSTRFVRSGQALRSKPCGSSKFKVQEFK